MQDRNSPPNGYCSNFNSEATSAPKGPIPLQKSILQSIVHFYGFKLQVQERITRQVAETVSSLLGGDVIVVVEASHSCMVSRGIEK
ncbi:GTP cyclohydrolase 1 [Vitis vinifera]|uniref:GTP cyclohydrolase 1 n=1 Tax=Vitis vinifera TaxID=29760 RepID=A0A438G4S0_VITVI|nr:GTP cyclohydrolase 1 [Vitis vinifera]